LNRNFNLSQLSRKSKTPLTFNPYKNIYLIQLNYPLRKQHYFLL